jgi:hypothetical protein
MTDDGRRRREGGGRGGMRRRRVCQSLKSRRKGSRFLASLLTPPLPHLPPLPSTKIRNYISPHQNPHPLRCPARTLLTFRHEEDEARTGTETEANDNE